MPSRTDLAKIHIAKKELGLSDDVYRALLQGRFGKRSAKQLTPGQAWKLLAYFKSQGWKPRHQASLPGVSVPADGQSKKIQALWITLHQAGVVKNGSDRALMAFVRRLTGRERLAWCTSQDKQQLIEALKEWGTREGVALE